MSGFLTPPTFAPPVYQIPLGSAGQVLTMVSGVPRFAAAGGGGSLGSYLAYASPAGAQSNVNPPGFGPTVGLLDVTLAGGSATWNSLVAGADKQMLAIANADAANNLTLAQAGFRAPGDVFIPPQSAVLLVYYTTPATWIVL